MSQEAKKFPELPGFEVKGVNRANLCVQFRELAKRAANALKRDPIATKGRVGQIVFMAVLVLILYKNNRDEPQNIEEMKQQMMSIAGMLFFCNMSCFMSAYMTTLTIFNDERPVIVREQANQMYDIFPYYFSRVIVENPLFLLSPLLFSTIMYFGVGLTIDAEHFFKFYLALAMLIQCALSFSYFVSAMIADGTTALMMGPILIFPFLLLGGFFTNSTGIQVYLQYIAKISPIRFSFEAVL